MYSVRLFVLFIGCLCLVQSKRHLLEEQISSLVDGFDLKSESSDESTQRLSRMLLAFQALGSLKGKGELLGDTSWRDSLLDHDKLDPLGLTDIAGAKISGAADAAASLVESKQNFVSKLVGVATGDLTFEQAASGQVSRRAAFCSTVLSFRFPR